MENSTKSSTGSAPSWEPNSVDHYTKMGKLTQLSRLLGWKHLKAHSQHQQQNLDTQAKAYRRQFLGDDKQVQGKDFAEDNDMREQIVLGDINNPAPVVITQSSGGNEILKLLAVAGMAAGIPLAGIAGYLLSQKDTKQPPNTTETIERDYTIEAITIEN